MIKSRIRDTIKHIFDYERCSMAVCYDKLFHLMIDKKISNVQLKDMAGVSANIITRLKRDEYISTESIEKICLALNCGVDDILEFVPEKEGRDNA